MESALTDTEVTSIPLSDTDSVYSLPHLVSKINPKDRGFLKYLPEQKLNAEQNATKRLALKEDKEKLDRLPKKSNGVKNQLKRKTNRFILANSLESAAQNDIERKKLAQYKEKISLIEAEEKTLAEIQKQLFTKGAVVQEKEKTEPILKDEFGFWSE